MNIFMKSSFSDMFAMVFTFLHFLLHIHLMIYPNYCSKEGKSWGAMEACEDDFDIHEEWQDE